MVTICIRISPGNSERMRRSMAFKDSIFCKNCGIVFVESFQKPSKRSFQKAFKRPLNHLISQDSPKVSVEKS